MKTNNDSFVVSVRRSENFPSNYTCQLRVRGTIDGIKLSIQLIALALSIFGMNCESHALA